MQEDEVGNRVRQAGEVVQEVCMYMFVCTCKLT